MLHTQTSLSSLFLNLVNSEEKLTWGKNS